MPVVYWKQIIYLYLPDPGVLFKSNHDQVYFAEMRQTAHIGEKNSLVLKLVNHRKRKLPEEQKTGCLLQVILWDKNVYM